MSKRYVFSLVVAQGKERVVHFGGASATIGRLSTADLRVADATASRLHARVDVAEDGSLSVVDTGGAGGIRVNGNEVQESPLVPGDVIALGRSEVTYVRSEEADDEDQSDASLSEVFEASREAKQVEEEALRRVAARDSADHRMTPEATGESSSGAVEATATEAVAFVEPMEP